jgi:serine/threonine protein phosphatase PrpC
VRKGARDARRRTHSHTLNPAATALIRAAEQKNARDDATCVVLFVKELDEPAWSDWCHDSGAGIGFAIKT